MNNEFLVSSHMGVRYLTLFTNHREVIFEVLQPMRSRYLNVEQTDARHTVA